jgi:hypothetical protein
MLGELEEYPLTLHRRRKLVDRLNETGYVLLDVGSGQSVFVANPREGHAKIHDHYLPAAFMRSSYVRLVNLDEPSLKEHHTKLREIYLSLI